MTVLRDLEGNVHFVPNGQSYRDQHDPRLVAAFFDIGVAYKENVDHVMTVINDLCTRSRRTALSSVILEPATMLGVDAAR